MWETLQSLVRGARESIDLAVFTLTDDRLSNALVEAHKRGVVVRLLSDDDKAGDKGSDIRRVRGSGLAVRTDRSPYHFPHKFAARRPQGRGDRQLQLDRRAGPRQPREPAGDRGRDHRARLCEGLRGAVGRAGVGALRSTGSVIRQRLAIDVAHPRSPMQISANFDSGNIEVVSAADASDIQLRIVVDAGGEHRQWFHFRVSGVAGTPLRMRILNAKQCSYPDAWEGYRAVASTDRQTWLRVPTSVVDGELVIEHTSDADTAWFAYFAPYSLERHHDLMARIQGDDRVTHEVLGQT